MLGLMLLSLPCFAEEKKIDAGKAPAAAIKKKVDVTASKVEVKSVLTEKVVSSTKDVVKDDLPPPAKNEPATTKEAIDDASKLFNYAKAKNWFGFSSLAILIVMFALRNFGLWKKIGKRWAYVAIPLFSISAALLAKFEGGVSWDAVWVVLSSGPCAAILSDFVRRGILGIEPTTPMNPSKPEETPPKA
jgi:hypothetical protein